MSTYGPRYIPSKNLFGYLGKFPLGAGFIPIFRREFYMEFSHPPPPPRHPPSPLPRELNQVSFLATSLEV